MKLDVERSGCQIIKDIRETLCHSLECFSEFPPRKEKKKKSNKVLETLSIDFVSL